jgi:60 kDa SS-A/Ro ribonucleoprotein
MPSGITVAACSRHMKINTPSSSVAVLTHEGAVAKRINSEQELRRSVMACLLWEDSFYESGAAIAERIQTLIPKVAARKVADIAVEARTKMKLRHVPLLLARELARGDEAARKTVGSLLEAIIQRPDELTEFLAIYWKDKRQPLSAQVKKGLARALAKFNEYALAKYDQDGTVKLRDVLFLTHAKPTDKEHKKLYKKLAEKKLKTPDTWEVALSSGADKKAAWERLLAEKKLGALALLRNLRNMKAAEVSDVTVAEALRDMNVERVLPFRFISAAKYAPHLEPALEQAMFRCLAGVEKLPGKTVLLIDVSGSMTSAISGKSESSRIDAANGLAILIREACEYAVIYTFSNNPRLVPARRGFALRDAVMAQFGGGTNTETAKLQADREGYDRLIILTDEQSHQALSSPLTDKGYVVNVAAYQNGIGYGKWNHIDGWSEAILDYIRQVEGE